MLRKVMIGGTPILGAVAVAKADVGEQKVEKTLICKPSELPIYSNPFASDKPLSEKGAHQSSGVSGSIEKGVRSVRVEISKAVNSVASQKQEIEKLKEEALLQTKFIREYLREEENSLPRVGAIGVGVLSGFIMGIRGGVFRRLLYSTVVGTGVASLCYPRDAKKYATVAYNFAYGIKPGDPRQIELPTFPTSMAELKSIVMNFSNSTMGSVFPPKK